MKYNQRFFINKKYLPTDVEYKRHIETYKSMIHFSSEGYKALLLLNGGGILSLISVFGRHINNMNYSLIIPLIFFIIGLIFISASYFFSYLVQLNIYNNLTYTKEFNYALDSSILGFISFIYGCITSIVFLILTI